MRTFFVITAPNGDSQSPLISAAVMLSNITVVVPCPDMRPFPMPSLCEPACCYDYRAFTILSFAALQISPLRYEHSIFGHSN